METEPSNFHHVTALVSRWMLDFFFTSLCQHFKEDNLIEFDLTLKKLEVNCEGCKMSNKQAQKWQIATFLGRIMHGSQIPDEVEGEGAVMPLMVATRLWRTLRDTVADEEKYDTVAALLHVQSLAVCLQEGRKDLASTALKWLKETQNIPKKLTIKLSTLVVKGDSNHPYIRNFPFRQLLEEVRLYLDSFLAENPSDFLLKAAETVVQSSHGPDYSGQQDECSSQTTENSSPAFKKRKKKRLFNSSKNELWLPPSGQKPQKNSSRLSAKRVTSPPRKRGRKRWTAFMDQVLVKAVRKHGAGNWRLMLLDYDFNGRTGVMLKDRWRILKRDSVA